MERITYDYYRIFYYVAKYKSISQAAEISQQSAEHYKIYE